jgi:hypothetical protein
MLRPALLLLAAALVRGQGWDLLPLVHLETTDQLPIRVEANASFSIVYNVIGFEVRGLHPATIVPPGPQLDPTMRTQSSFQSPDRCTVFLVSLSPWPEEPVAQVPGELAEQMLNSCAISSSVPRHWGWRARWPQCTVITMERVYPRYKGSGPRQMGMEVPHAVPEDRQGGGCNLL